jgi:hypothetical protein
MNRLLLLAIAFALTLIAVPGAAQSAPRKATFALIVTNNRSTRLGRAELRYADDDGAKYYETLRPLAGEDRTFLLTEFDRDTERLFADLKSKALPPDRAHLAAAAARIAEQARAARAAGSDVELYFVFAGHGDVDEGRGFLELADAPFTSDDLYALLQSIPSTRSHVILDSCNSFFVINARKPGGRHFATPEDAARALSDRLPNVGVFLSTSAEAEVYEWSELQSGIFSYAVRSGLSGAADANGDGAISYAELRAFVNIASAEVKNPAYRPRVFARGPGGNDSGALVDLRDVPGARVGLDPARSTRLTVRDPDDVPWIDVHTETGARTTLLLPAPWGPRAVLLESATSPDGSATKKRYTLDIGSDGAPAALAQLTPTVERASARGPDDMFRALFARPFGPRAFAQYEAEERSRPAPVYGISADDRERMILLLDQVASIDRSGRFLRGAAFMTAGAAVGAAGGIALDNTYRQSAAGDRTAALSFGYITAGAGVALLAAGALALAIPSRGEDLDASFRLHLAAGDEDPGRLVADTERRLFALAEQYRTSRLVGRWASILVMAAGVACLATSSINPSQRDALVFEGVDAMAIGAVAAGISFIPTPVERMVDLWQGDPSLQRIPRASFTVMGLGLGLSGTF